MTSYEVIDLDSDTDTENSSDNGKIISTNVLTESKSAFKKGNENDAAVPQRKKLKVSSDKVKPFEDVNFLNILILLMRNIESATIEDIWRYLSDLFPIYKQKFTSQQGKQKLRKYTNRALFLKTGLERNKNLIMLNPLHKENHELSISIFKDKHCHHLLKSFLSKPELSAILIDGLYNLRTGNINPQHKNSNQDLNAESVIMPAAESTSFERVSSPLSDDSTDTVIFELPRITNCETLTKSDFDESKDETQIEDQTVLGQLVNVTYLPNSNLGSFANTVWSSDNGKVFNLDKNEVAGPSKNLPVEQSFPAVDNMIPKWQRIFPWVVWDSFSKTISCKICQSICSKINITNILVVKSIVNEDEVFTVSRSLREHSDTISHGMASILDKKDIISILHFLISYHFSEFNTVSDILLSFEGLMDCKNDVTNDTLNETIKMLGTYLEERILSSLKEKSQFSLITDPCCGLLIVKWLNANDEPEEHIISSYISVNDKNPLQYLISLGVDPKKMVGYISNQRCKECNKCQVTNKVPWQTRTPLRLPELDKYFIWLWRSKLLKPFQALGSAVSKLWFSYPHKFSNINDRSLLSKLSKFSCSPEIFKEIFNHINEFKEIASSIYKVSGNLEALGLMKLDVSEDMSKCICIFPILSSINSLLLEYKCHFPFSSTFDKILAERNLLEESLNSVKEKIKRKEVVIPGLNSNDVDEVLKLVDLVVKEFQLPIYHKGRSVKVSFGRCSSYDYLSEHASNSSVQNDFNILYTSLSNFRHENTVLLKSLIQFFSKHRQLEKKNSLAVLKFFNLNPEAKSEHDVVYDFYKQVSLFGFEIPNIELCLYEVKIYDLLFYRSAWSGIGPNIKEYLLTITSELSGNNKLVERDMYQWWFTKNNNLKESFNFGNLKKLA